MAKSHQDILTDISELNAREKHKLFSALKTIMYPLAPGITQFLGDLRETKFSGGLACLYCQGAHVVRNGKLNGRQRYYCRDCKRTFNDFTNTPMQRTQLPDKWLAFLDCMIQGLSLRKAAKEIGGVTHVTLFYWRHKILKALCGLDVARFDGITELDETYFRYSEKGRLDITGREPRHRGGKAKKRGISDEQVGVLVVCDRQKQNISKVSGTGRMSAATLSAMIADKVNESTILCSDADTAIRSFTKEHNIEHVELNTRKKQRVKQGIYHIQHVNSYHKQLKDWLDRFNGVATKYLDNYLAWFRFITMTKDEEVIARRKQLLIEASQFNMVTTCRSLRISPWDLATI